MAERVVKAETSAKKKISNCLICYSKFCKIFCNSNKAIYDHDTCRKHKHTVQRFIRNICCNIFDCKFCNAVELAFRNISATYIETVKSKQQKEISKIRRDRENNSFWYSSVCRAKCFLYKNMQQHYAHRQKHSIYVLLARIMYEHWNRKKSH